jgi:hypothetical protein
MGRRWTRVSDETLGLRYGVTEERTDEGGRTQENREENPRYAG